jgi:bifunctional DNA-binding transcriptional regulator/antitoxin component of YhaV-PrlF toxin-antitoxin module
MPVLTVTVRGQVTFRKDVLQHLGVKPGEKIELELLPDGRGLLRAAQPAGTIDGFVGLLARRRRKAGPAKSEDCRRYQRARPCRDA